MAIFWAIRGSLEIIDDKIQIAILKGIIFGILFGAIILGIITGHSSTGIAGAVGFSILNPRKIK